MINRLGIFDDSIRNHHIFNPEVYIEDPDKMAGVALYLMELGYDIEPVSVHIGGLFKGKQYLSYDRLSRCEILSINKWGIIGGGGISDFNDRKGSDGHRDRVVKKLNEYCEKYRYMEIDGEQIDLHPISCEDNIELFKHLALYRDDTDYGKIIYYENPHPQWFEHHNEYGKLNSDVDRISINCQWDNFEKECDIDWVKERCRMLYTLDEIMEVKDLMKQKYI